MIMGMKANQAVSVDKYHLIISGRNIPHALLTGGIFAVVLIILLYAFFGTEMGSAIRATGCNLEMSKAQGINTNRMKVIGLALSNGLVALAGAVMAQQQRFFEISMGTGAMVIGLASVIIGTNLFHRVSFMRSTTMALIGSILYKACVALALQVGLDASYMKLITAVLFLLSLFLRPLFASIPQAATAPALIAVGVMMVTPIGEINFADFRESVPSFLCILFMICSFSISDGIMFGVLGYVLVNALSGRIRQIDKVMWVLAVLFVLRCGTKAIL